MEANAPPAGSWHRRLRPPRPPVGAWESPSLSSLPPGSRYTADLGILTKMLRPFLTSALARGQRGSAIINVLNCKVRRHSSLPLRRLSTRCCEVEGRIARAPRVGFGPFRSR